MHWAARSIQVSIGVILLASTALATTWPGALPIASASATYPRGSIDSPPDGATVSGAIQVTGWAVDLAASSSTGVDSVDISVDNALYGHAVYGRTRNDLAGYGPQFVPSGFLYLLDTSLVGGGTHTLEARAHSTITNVATSYTHTLIINAPPATPRPTSTSTPVPTNTSTPAPGTPTPTATSTSTATATATPLPPTNFPKHFGMNAHLTWYDLPHATIDVDRIRFAGLTSVRSDVTWKALEPTSKGSYDPTYLAELDAALNMVTSRGMQPLLVLIDTPAWARGNTGTVRTPPTNVQDYADTLGFLAQRYQGLPNMAYEVWNEPNQVVFWDTPNGPDALAYSSMLKKSYASIKANAPGATVVGGAIAENDQPYLQSLFAFGGIVGYYDVFSVHTYSGANAPDSTVDGYRTFRGLLQQTAQLMAQYGDQGKPIWITEFGWDTPTQVSETTRAAYFRQAVDVARSFPQVAQLMAYAEDQVDDAGFGLVTPAGTLTSTFLGFSLAASVPNSASSRVAGSLDSPQEWASANNIGMLRVSGWAIDAGATSGTGVDQAQVYVDGTYVGDATYSIARVDIGSGYGVAFTNSGFLYQLNLANVAVGYHTLELRARSTVTGAASSYTQPITINPIPTSPHGSVDSPKPGTSWARTLSISGWAIDAAARSGTGVNQVQIYFDGVYAANAVYGGARSDIGAAFGAQFTNSRFAYTLDLTGVPAGSHVVTAHARSAQTGVEAMYTSTITVTTP